MELVPFVGILMLAAIVEALVEYLAKPVIDLIEARVRPEPDPAPADPALDWFDVATQYIAAGVGILLCVLYAADILALVGLHAKAAPWIGAVITGALIGRGANFINDFAGRYLDKPGS